MPLPSAAPLLTLLLFLAPFLPIYLSLTHAAALPQPSPPTPRAVNGPQQIRGVADPIYHLYLQALPSNTTKAVLGPEASAGTFDISTTIRSNVTGAYLNIVGSPGSGVSYKEVVFGTAGSTAAWGLEGDTIITTTGSVWGRQLNFLVCQVQSGYYSIYLQTGSDTPSGQTCSNYQTLHLPCLC